MKYKREKGNNKGFTLAEMLIVVAIIGVLAAISVPVFTDKLEKARETTDVANMRSAKAAAILEYLNGSNGDLDDAGAVYYYNASEGTLETEKEDAFPAYGQGTGTVDGGLRFEDYNEAGADGAIDGTDARNKVIKVTVTPSEHEDSEEGIDVAMEWVD